jgi:uncharacterized protein YbcI
LRAASFVFESGRERLAMSSTIQGDARRGRVTAQVSDALVKLLATHTGHGAKSAWTTIIDDLIVCVLEDLLTTGERSLVEHGDRATVLNTRRAFQAMMEAEAVQIVEEISGRSVTAFMSTNHIDPDLAVEVFVLEPLANGADGAAED